MLVVAEVGHTQGRLVLEAQAVVALEVQVLPVQQEQQIQGAEEAQAVEQVHQA